METKHSQRNKQWRKQHGKRLFKKKNDAVFFIKCHFVEFEWKINSASSLVPICKG